MADFKSNDPFRPLLSLADQKTLKVNEKLVEKKANLNESAVLTEAKAARDRLLSQGPEDSNLIDIAQSSIFQGNEVIFDAATGRTRSPEDIQQLGDITQGVTEEVRNRLVTQPQQEVIESLAAGNYLDALVGSVKAAPGTLADSANVIPEIAGGAALTIAGGAGLGVLANRVRKIFGGGKKVIEQVSKAKKVQGRLQLIKEAAKTLPKTASQMSVVTADITQRQIADFVIEQGERPSNERIAAMYAINLATMTAEGGILKQLFIPKFKKEFIKEARAAVANIKSGSNLVSIGARIGQGIKKTLIAGGAEAAQEYVQTWADIINPQIGPNEDFIKGIKRELGNKDNQLQALGGSFLGFGAGGLARGVIAAPAVAAGTAIDVTKGTVKTAVKATVGVVKTAGRVVQKVANKAAFQVLSQEELDVIESENQSRKTVVDKKVTEFESAVETIKKSKTISELRKNERISKAIDRSQEKSKLTDTDLENPEVFNKFKHGLVRAFRGDIGLLKTELKLSNVADIAKKSAQNIQTKSVKVAKAVVEAIAPGVEAVLDTVKDLGPKFIKL